MFYGTQNVFYSLCNPSKAVNTEIFRQKAQKKNTHTKTHTKKTSQYIIQQYNFQKRKSMPAI